MNAFLKILCCSILLLFANGYSFAQSDNLCPENNVPILNVNNCTSNTDYTIFQNWSVDNNSNVSNNTACVSFANNKRDGWFKFVATSNSSTINATVANNRNVALALYTGTCGSMTELACVNAGGNGNTETITYATTPGTTYYIRVIRYNSGGSTNNNMDGTIEVLSPITNNNCVGAISLTPSVPGGACNPICGSVYGANASSPPTGCSGTANNDVWYSFVATQITHIITVDGSASFNAVVEILSGNTCAALTNLGCADLTGDDGIETLTANGLIAGNTYYIRVYDQGNNTPGTLEFSICVTTPILPVCPAGLGLGVVNVASLPYTSSGRTTSGRGNEITALNATVCGNSNYYQGNDEVFIFTPTTTGNISVSLTSGSSNVGIMLYDGCPFVGQGGSCVAYSQSTSGNQFFCANVIAGNTYYLVVDRNSGSSITNYSITITAPTVGLPAGSTCAVAIPVTLPYTATNQTTLCKGNDYNNASVGSCLSLYESGEDMVYGLTVGGPQCIKVTLSNTSSIQTGFQLYEGCPGTAGANCLGFVGGGNVSSNFSLPNAGTFYIIVDSWDPPSGVTYDINIISTPSGTPNDFPCNATTLPLSTNVNGDNSCSTAFFEPASVPSCWSTGALNTVWYRVTPTTTSLIIKTFLGTLSNTQIALYQGACNALTQVTPSSSTCNDDITCGANSVANSQMTVNGLTIGQTYYIRVDGRDDRTGTFGIIAVPGNVGLPPVYGQDCSTPLPVCQNSIAVGNPGFSAFGNVCDFNNGINCLNSGERSGSWYTIPIGANGALEFDIIANDWLGAPSTTSTDYDFAIWEVGNSNLQCSQLNSATPTRCNYSALGVTGCAGTGNSPGAYPGFNGSYESAINVTAGQVYLLFISNYTNSTSGFTLNISSAPDPVNYSTAPPTVTWLGGTNTSWSISANWGTCNVPTCANDAFVNASSINQPVVFVNQTIKDITINPGASLTINPNITLSICGDFTNNGSLITLPGSTVKFIGSGTQNINGSLTGANSFANFTMEKPSGTLIANTNLGIKENDSLKTGYFDNNSHDIYVGKNFYISNGSSTHISPVIGGKYEFNANAINQTFTNLGDDVTFNDIVMNQTTNNSMILGVGLNNDLRINGTLNLVKGKIVTNAKQVYVLNPINLAVNAGNATSYVEGNLRRALNVNATGVYEFPVGHSLKGYQRASVDFTAATQIPELTAKFTPWPAVPIGPVSSECVFADYSLNPALNNGFWTFGALANSNTGTYNMSLYNTNYTNAASPGGWTVMKRIPVSTGPWALDGNCVLTSTVTSTQRTVMNTFDADFATAQSTSPLPIELINFEAKKVNEGVQLVWVTATEINNDYFNVERSYDGKNFVSIAVINGAGNSTQELHYSYLDKSPGTGLIYYRLKQTDFDLRYSYSEIVAVKINEKILGLNLYPNPVESTLNFNFESSGETVKIQIADVTGRIVYEESKQFKSGKVDSEIKLNEFSEGVYFLILTCDESIAKNWFVKRN